MTKFTLRKARWLYLQQHYTHRPYDQAPMWVYTLDHCISHPHMHRLYDRVFAYLRAALGVATTIAWHNNGSFAQIIAARGPKGILI